MEHHQYERTSDSDNNTCTECGVIVDERVLEPLMLMCPVRPCTEPSNEGQPCVFVPSETVPVCAYCDRNGDPHGEYDGTGDIWVELPDVEIEDDEEDQLFG